MADAHDVETAEYNLSELIDFNVTFKPLQITLNKVLKRLAALEDQNEQQSETMQQMQNELDAMRRAQEANDAQSPVKSLHAEEGDAHSGHDELWAAIDGIKALLGDLQDSDEQQRATIDELYAARKRRASEQYARVGSGVAKDHGSPTASATPPLKAREEARRESQGAAGSAIAPPARRPTQNALLATEEEMPVGDVILNLAHEELPLDFDATVAFPGGDVPQPEGGEMPTNERPGSSSSAGAKHPMPPPPRHSTPPPSTGVSGANVSSPPKSVSMERPQSGVSADTFVPKPFDPSAVRPGSSARAPRVSGASRSLSVMGRIREDGEDIAYLNRVVAEMLAEMKGLHNDVDLMRTTQENAAHEAPASSGTTGNADLSDLLRRLEALEGNLDAHASTSQLRNNGLQADLDELRTKLRPASYMTDADIDNIHNIAEMQEKLRELEDRVKVLEKANERLDDKLSRVLNVAGNSDGTAGEVNAAQFALLAGTVDALEKQLAELQGRGEKDWSEEIERLQTALQRLREEADALTTRVGATEREASRLDETKADRTDLPTERRVSAAPSASSADLDQLTRQLAALAARIDAGYAKDRELEENKADRESLQRLRDDLSNLKKVMEVQMADRDAHSSGKDGSGQNTSAATEQLLRELQQQLIDQADRNASASADREDITGLRELVEELEHRKADATLVANKAERDYVENALERLMREVEQVLNATNAGIIDTLDKSLNILRDMIDGRASKQDIARLQQMIAEDGNTGGTPDGLTGFKGYRCLGCNRPMDSLRPRAQAAKLQPFVNRNPQNYPQDNVTRTIQQQQQTSALLESRGANGVSSDVYPSIEGPQQ